MTAAVLLQVVLWTVTLIIIIPTRTTQNVEAFQNTAGTIRTAGYITHQHHNTNHRRTVVLPPLQFQKAPAVAEAVKQSKEKEEQENQNDKENTNSMIMTAEDEAILFGHEDLFASQSQSVPLRSQRGRPKDHGGNVLEDTLEKKVHNKQTLVSDQTMIDLDYSTTNPLLNKLRTIRDNTLENCPQLWTEVAKVHPDGIALIDDHLCDQEKIQLTYAAMDTIVNAGAAIFRHKFGLQPGQHVAILAENSARWLQLDHSIQRAGGVSAVRGADAPLDELRYIYNHSDSAQIVILQGPNLFQKLLDDPTVDHSSSCLGLANAAHGKVKYVVLMNREKKTLQDLEHYMNECNVELQLYFWDDLVAQETTKGIHPQEYATRFPTVTKDDVATIVYTSGTTGQPKGVMLTHGNLLHQTSHRLGPSKPYEETEPLPNETMVSLLPVWHITERTFEIWMLSRGCTVVYSGIRYFKADMAQHQPEWLVLVPRVLEKIAAGVQDKFSKGSVPVKVLSKVFTKTGTIRATQRKIANGVVVSNRNDDPSGLARLVAKAIVLGLAPLNYVGDKLVWQKVQDGFGGHLKTIISGGSALSGALETFYETAGFNIIVGYGLTECSPLLAHRRSDGNLVTSGCCGTPILDTEIRVVAPDSKATYDIDRPSLPDGEVGVVIGRGPSIMKGYYKNAVATKQAIDQYGWFDTGDLGRINPATGDLILTGRVKDTIVLTNGENIEPTPIEDAIMSGSAHAESGDLIDQVMVTGGPEGKKLMAIVVLNPTELVTRGYLSSTAGTEYAKANESMNDPQCTPQERDKYAAVLQRATDDLRTTNPQQLQQALLATIKGATSGKGGGGGGTEEETNTPTKQKQKQFRPWEVVNTVHFTLEPFAMSNGQLTQSYKVKRDAVYERYCDELPS